MPSRRRVLCAAVTAVLAVPLASCAGQYSGTRLRFVTGPPEGLWFTFGSALANQWQRSLGVLTDVARSVGPPENMATLLSGNAELALNGADVAADALSAPGLKPMALGRVYDDFIQVLVRAESPLRRLADLRGRRVWTAPGASPTLPASRRLLGAAGLAIGRDFVSDHSDVPAAFTGLTSGRIDAVVFSGGLPTPGVVEAAKRTPLRVLDLSDVASPVQRRWTEYGVATVPSSVYRSESPVTTLTVPNYLLATQRLGADLASAMLDTMFREKGDLAPNLPAAQYLDPAAAVETSPVPLHPGALAYYRATAP